MYACYPTIAKQLLAFSPGISPPPQGSHKMQGTHYQQRAWSSRGRPINIKTGHNCRSPYVMSAAESTSSAELWREASLGLHGRQTLGHCPRPSPTHVCIRTKRSVCGPNSCGPPGTGSRLPWLSALCEYGVESAWETAPEKHRPLGVCTAWGSPYTPTSPRSGCNLRGSWGPA